MGDDLASPFDNIKAQKMGGAYDILNKKLGQLRQVVQN